MKIKRLPEDFCVQELTDVAPAKSGEFALYRLNKRGLGTPEAAQAIVRRWKLSDAQLSFGGLKDKHAVTTQFLTIQRGPRRGLRQTHLELAYLGQADHPFTSQDIRGNHFEIVVRDLAGGGVDHAAAELAGVARDGLPNYFDDQRFGSLGATGEFAGRAWADGDYERAIWLALADANPLDRPHDRAEKEWLRAHWGDWARAAEPIHSAPRARVIAYLRDRPGDFRGAIARIPPSLRSLYLAAFQSDLWNRMLAELLRERCRPEQLVTVRLRPGPVPFDVSLDPALHQALAATELPYPSARLHLEPGPLLSLVERTLAQQGLELRQLRVKYPRDSFFAKGSRPARFDVKGLNHHADRDDLHEGRRKLTLAFDLPRGCYATLLVKRLAATSPESGGVDAADELETHEEP